MNTTTLTNFDDIASLLKPRQRSYFENVFRLLNRKISMHEFAVILRAAERAKPMNALVHDLSLSAHPRPTQQAGLKGEGRFRT